jgi:hypothetical protein
MNVNNSIDVIDQAELFSDEVYSHFEEFSEYNNNHEEFEKKIYYISSEYLIYLHINKETKITTVNIRNFLDKKERRVWIKKEMIDAYILNLLNRLENGK